MACQELRGKVTEMKQRKGIVLAGGTGTRLWPVTKGISKQLLPVFSKPMIYYPISVLMLGGMREIAIITTPDEQGLFQKLLDDGSQWGVQFEWVIQAKPEGIAQALTLTEEFLNGSPSALILGDNLFYGHGLAESLAVANQMVKGAKIFAYQVVKASDYGVVEFGSDYKAISIEEKPENPKSNWAVTGLYFYDETASARTRSLKPSARGELEITALNASYLADGALETELLGRGFAWLDTGTHDSLLEAANYVAAIERRQGSLVCSPEEIAFRNGWISAGELLELSQPLSKTEYGKTLQRIASGEVQ